MKHYGDITKIKGNEVPIVDVICGGSPCQDLSVAGKRAGLDGERSGLFMEQIRIIREQRNECLRQLSMRRSNEPVRPRYMVWENVPGAFSSNKGEDFRIVLEEVCRIADQTAVIPMPDKWSTSGCIMGSGWSVAWRVHDAQFWGVAQRRRRIALVADFNGNTAPEILFEREGVPGNIETSEQQGKGITRITVKSPNETGCAYDGTQISPTLTAHNANGSQRMPDKENFNAVIAFDRAAYNQGQNAQYDFSVEEELAQTIVAKGPGGVVTRQ